MALEWEANPEAPGGFIALWDAGLYVVRPPDSVGIHTAEYIIKLYGEPYIHFIGSTFGADAIKKRCQAHADWMEKMIEKAIWENDGG